MYVDCKAALSNASDVARSCSRGVGHATLLTTAMVADTLGYAILAAGLSGAGFLAADSYMWSNGTSPVWANIYGDKPLPLLSYPTVSCDRNGCKITDHFPIESSISLGSLISLGLALGTPLATYACFQAAKLARQIDRDLFKTV